MTHDQAASGGASAAAADPVEVIAELFASEGLAGYLGEDVTQAVHMLQTAALAERDGAGDALIAADHVQHRHPAAAGTHLEQMRHGSTPGRRI